ncbi:RNB domain-containing ribonuclease [Marihabitans asiaticum]|uniref:RNB domain-containing protein n=1 Tax=Marihabitans asiaticum TaxID=415218 RepID=A0A560WAF8_9MICO|nr:RNB domain-containing ribonuclease [Marihabitans asiaticum]TWD14619.1 RNB domain-containing protein [Marihabitans asiaticum]
MPAQRPRTIRPTRTTLPSGVPGGDGSALHERFEQIRDELEVPAEFPDDVLAEASRVAEQPLHLPGRDETDVPFFTIDPPGSMDLDQAMHLERDGEGHRVRYAIAYLDAFVAPGGAVHAEARRRGQTIYSPDTRTPLHPPVFSEGAASLLPGQRTPAYVWDLRLDAEGEVVRHELYAAMVRSVDRLDYDQAQAELDDGDGEGRIALLAEVGRRRIALEEARGGATLPMPEQEVVLGADGQVELTLRPLLPVERFNAQISLMTGMVAGELMLSGRVGVLRTMPAPEDRAIRQLRAVALGLGVDWPREYGYGELLRSLDVSDPAHLALVHEATMLFRGAGYTAFDGELPEETEQAAIAAPYAHVTAPLRRLVDRFGLAVCAAISSGDEAPGWAREALPDLPEIMERSGRLAGAVERACTDTVEAVVLAGRVGDRLPAVVVDDATGRSGGQVEVQLQDPPVLARASHDTGTKGVELGSAVTVRVVTADVASSRVELEIVG